MKSIVAMSMHGKDGSVRERFAQRAHFRVKH